MVRNKHSLNIVIFSSANGEEILRLQPFKVIDQSVSPQNYIAYYNNTIYILERDHVILDIIKDVHNIQICDDNNKLASFTSSSPDLIPGGGQFFVYKNLGLYSIDVDLNDRIGSALITAASSSFTLPELN